MLTQISAFWFRAAGDVFPSHYVTARHRPRSSTQVPAARGARGADRRPRHAGAPRRAGAVRVRGPGIYLRLGLGRVPEPRNPCGRAASAGLVESARLDPPLFSPATKAEAGHDINVTFDAPWRCRLGAMAARLREASFAIYQAGRDHAAERGIIIADTKFEFGIDPAGTLRLIDEVLTPDSPDSGRPTAMPRATQPSFDKQPLRDYLASLKAAGRWNGEAPPPSLPPEVVDGHQPQVPRGVPAAHRPDLERSVVIRTAPEGIWFIVGAWLVAAASSLQRFATIPTALDRLRCCGSCSRSGWSPSFAIRNGPASGETA